jgi:hypothetical protein
LQPSACIELEAALIHQSATRVLGWEDLLSSNSQSAHKIIEIDDSWMSNEKGVPLRHPRRTSIRLLE